MHDAKENDKLGAPFMCFSFSVQIFPQGLNMVMLDGLSERETTDVVG